MYSSLIIFRFLTLSVICQKDFKSVIFQRLIDVLNNRDSSNNINFQTGPILRVILPKVKVNVFGHDEFFFNYSGDVSHEKFYLITSRSPYNEISGNCLFNELGHIKITNLTFLKFLVTDCSSLSLIKINCRNISLKESPVLLIESQYNAVNSMLHLMTSSTTIALTAKESQIRQKRSLRSRKCSLYPLQVDLSTLYDRQYTVGGIVQIGYCHGDCSNEIHLLTFHARVRLLIKQRHSFSGHTNLSNSHCGPEKYKSHKIMYIEPDNEQMHIIMEIKDLVVESCNCH